VARGANANLCANVLCDKFVADSTDHQPAEPPVLQMATPCGRSAVRVEGKLTGAFP
jgi:hypothetical protein